MTRLANSPAIPSVLELRGGPTLLVFVSSACVMILEIVAGRLIASHLGSSLYTWTSVIGVVLAGIAVGNHLGGRLADRLHPRALLGSLFLAGAAASMAILAIDAVVESIGLFSGQTWPIRIALSVTTIFFLPSCVLGTISPVVMTATLKIRDHSGATVGHLYAAGAIGGVAGTFLAGFVLVGQFGTTAIIFGVAATLALLALTLVMRSQSQLAAALLLSTSFVAAYATAQGDGWIRRATVDPISGGRNLDGDERYEKDSDYFHILVVPAKTVDASSELAAEYTGARALLLDAMVHGLEVPGHPERLVYRYERITAWLTGTVIAPATDARTLFIGGGAYTLPRYIEAVYPMAAVDVLEIDPEVTEAAYEALGLSRSTRIQSFNEDARLYFRRSEHHAKYDVVYGDAFAGFSVPAHLTTLEFVKSIKEVLRPDGAYIINIVDGDASSQFHGAMYNTLKSAFEFVEVYTLVGTYERQNYVLYASDAHRGLDAPDLQPTSESRVVRFSDVRIAQLVESGNGVVLTDDFAPIEQLMMPMYAKRRTF